MRKWTAIALLTALLLMATPMAAFASDGLPGLQLPASYEDLVKGLMQQGYGQYKFDPTKPLPLPEVENPAGWGRKATDTFNDNYQSVLTDPRYQLDTRSAIPSDAINQSVRDFAQTTQGYFGDSKARDSAAMSKLLSAKLDMSSAWDFNAVRNSVKLMTPSDAKSFAEANKPKTADYDANRQAGTRPLEDANSWTFNNIGSIVPGLGYAQKSLDGMAASLDVDPALLNKVTSGVMNGMVPGSGVLLQN